jgi:hypothetical protein
VCVCDRRWWVCIREEIGSHLAFKDATGNDSQLTYVRIWCIYGGELQAHQHTVNPMGLNVQTVCVRVTRNQGHLYTKIQNLQPGKLQPKTEINISQGTRTEFQIVMCWAGPQALSPPSRACSSPSRAGLCWGLVTGSGLASDIRSPSLGLKPGLWYIAIWRADLQSER